MAARWPARVRLTVLYAMGSVLACAVLTTVTYVGVSRELTGSESRSDRAAVGDALAAYRADLLDRLLPWSLVALTAMLVLAVCVGWMIAGRVLRPVQRITDTARWVADRDPHGHIAMPGPQDELKELADTFDDLLERLNRSFDAQRRFAANASHELRTPLAINRTVLEVALADPLASDDLRQLGSVLVAINERSELLVEDLLTPVRVDEPVARRTPLR